MACLLLMVLTRPFAAPMNNADVIKLISAGMDESIIVEAITNSEPQFNTSADELINLRKAGASSAVLARIISASAGTGGQSTVRGAEGGCKKASAGDINLTAGSASSRFGYRKAREVLETSGAARGFASILTFGIVKMHKRTDYAVLPGNESDHRYKQALIEFSGLAVRRGLNPADGIKLVKLQQDGIDSKTGRSVAIGEGTMSYWGSVSGAIVHTPVESAVVPIKFEQEEECKQSEQPVTVWKAATLSEVEPGEYALIVEPDKYYDFAIDEPPGATKK